MTHARSNREAASGDQSASWIASRTIFRARNLHRPARRADFVSHLVRLRDDGVRVEHAVEAGIATLRTELLAEVLDVFATGMREAHLTDEPEVERMDDPLAAAILLARSGLGIDRVLGPFARLSLTEPEGRLMDVLVLREAEGSLTMHAGDFRPYLPGAAPRPFRTWIASRPDEVLDSILHFALTWPDYPLAEAALAVGATARSWSRDMVQAVRERPAHHGAIEACRTYEAAQGKGAAEALVELALGTTEEAGRIAARQRYPDIDLLLGPASGTGRAAGGDQG